MKLHRNARSCPNSRALIARRVLKEGWSLTQAAEAAGVSEPTARKWVRRARADESLEDRSSRPQAKPFPPPQALGRGARGAQAPLDDGGRDRRDPGYEDGVRRGQTRYEYVHVMVDDHSRLAYAEVLKGLTARCAVAFLRRAVAWFAERGVKIRA